MWETAGPRPLFAELSKGELRQLRELSCRELALQAEEPLALPRDLTEHFYLLLSGELRIARRADGQEATVSTRGKEGGADHPLLLATPHITVARALRPSRLLEVPADAYLQWVSGISPANGILVPLLVQRVKTAETLLVQGEKMAALGRMAAGLAHELNNPASAVSRSSGQLSAVLQGLMAGASGLLRQPLAPDQWDRLLELHRDTTGRASLWPSRRPPSRSPLAVSDLEETLGRWLSAHGVADGWRLAPELAEAGLDEPWLEALAGAIPPEALEPALKWIQGGMAAAQLIAEIEEGATRLSELVKAVKSYSYMDRAPQQETDVHEGLESTLLLLRHRMKEIELVREYDRSLPRIQAWPGELNQVWTNLLANALEALGGQGRIWVRSWREQGWLVVEIADDGPGIPPEIQARIFEPFFTTKAPGQGSGLGLDISCRIVAEKHHGDLRLNSVPGDTRFQVRLPLTP